MNKFWEFKNSVKGQGSDLYLEGEISSTTWWGDEVTPEAFRDELNKNSGTVTVHLNSPGGDVFAGVSIYNALKDYSKRKKCSVVIKVDGLAASIASVVAMAGDEIIMSPGSMMMIHNPWSMGAGSSEELRKTADLLDEIKESIIPIYTERTGKSEDEIIELMDSETWMSAEKAVELGFADCVKTEEKEDVSMLAMRGNFAFSMSATKSAMVDLIKKVNNERNTTVDPEEEKKLAEDVEVKEDGTIEGTVDGEKVELTPDEETKKEIEEAEEEPADEPAEEAEEETEEKSEDENAEEGEKEEEAEEEAKDEGEEIADKIEAEIKALREENAELKAKLEEAEAKNAKASASLSAQNRLQARYAAILNMAEEADGGETTSENEGEKTVDTYGNALSDAFKNL